MKLRLLIIAGIVFIFITALAYDLTYRPPVIPKEESTPAGNTQAEVVPGTLLRSVEGKEFSLREYQGRVVLLNFWATWCTPCKKEFPAMIRLLDAMDGKVVLVAVSNDVSPDDIKTFEEKYALQHHVPLKHPNLVMVWDEGMAITSRQFGTSRLPETIIIDSASRMVRKEVGGEVVWDSPEMQKYLHSLLPASQP